MYQFCKDLTRALGAISLILTAGASLNAWGQNECGVPAATVTCDSATYTTGPADDIIYNTQGMTLTIDDIIYNANPTAVNLTVPSSETTDGILILQGSSLNISAGFNSIATQVVQQGTGGALATIEDGTIATRGNSLGGLGVLAEVSNTAATGDAQITMNGGTITAGNLNSAFAGLIATQRGAGATSINIQSGEVNGVFPGTIFAEQVGVNAANSSPVSITIGTPTINHRGGNNAIAVRAASDTGMGDVSIDTGAANITALRTNFNSATILNAEISAANSSAPTGNIEISTDGTQLISNLRGSGGAAIRALNAHTESTGDVMVGLGAGTAITTAGDSGIVATTNGLGNVTVETTDASVETGTNGTPIIARVASAGGTDPRAGNIEVTASGTDIDFPAANDRVGIDAAIQHPQSTGNITVTLDSSTTIDGVPGRPRNIGVSARVEPDAAPGIVTVNLLDTASITLPSDRAGHQGIFANSGSGDISVEQSGSAAINVPQSNGIGINALSDGGGAITVDQLDASTLGLNGTGSIGVQANSNGTGAISFTQAADVGVMLTGASSTAYRALSAGGNITADFAGLTAATLGGLSAVTSGAADIMFTQQTGSRLLVPGSGGQGVVAQTGTGTITLNVSGEIATTGANGDAITVEATASTPNNSIVNFLAGADVLAQRRVVSASTSLASVDVTIDTGASAVGDAFLLSNQDDTITSSGTVGGNITGNDGNDVVTVNDGTTTATFYAGGNGDDSLLVNGGTVSITDFFGGADSDTFELTDGAFNGNVRTGTENDTLTVSGGVFTGDLFGGANDDTFSWTGGALNSGFFGDTGLDIATIAAGAIYDGNEDMDGGEEIGDDDSVVDALSIDGHTVPSWVPGVIVNWESIVITNSTLTPTGTGTLGAGTAPGLMLDASSSLLIGSDGFSMSGNFQHDGDILLTDDGAAGGQFVVNGNYTGGGNLELDTELGTDNSPTDRLVINGDATGETQLTINVTGGEGALRTGNGILIVSISGNSDATFTLTNPEDLVANGTIYNFVQLGSNWYLQSPMGPSEIPSLPPLALMLLAALMGLLAVAYRMRLQRS